MRTWRRREIKWLTMVTEPREGHPWDAVLVDLSLASQLLTTILFTPPLYPCHLLHHFLRAGPYSNISPECLPGNINLNGHTAPILTCLWVTRWFNVCDTGRGSGVAVITRRGEEEHTFCVTCGPRAVLCFWNWTLKCILEKISEIILIFIILWKMHFLINTILET